MTPETIEIIKQLVLTVPWGVVLIALRWLDIKEKADERKEREAAATAKAVADRETQLVIGKAYADAINNLASSIGDLKNTIFEQYKNIGVTKDLGDAARREIRQRKGD